jgi:hypothetical protein
LNVRPHFFYRPGRRYADFSTKRRFVCCTHYPIPALAAAPIWIGVDPKRADPAGRRPPAPRNP